MGFVPGHWGWGSPGETWEGSGQGVHSSGVLLLCSHLPMCPCALLACGHQTSLWLSDGSCNGPDSSWGRILFGLPTPLPLSLCAPLWLCRWAFITKHFPLLLVYSLRWFCLVTLMAKRKKNESKDSVQERSLRSISVFLYDLG